MTASIDQQGDPVTESPAAQDAPAGHEVVLERRGSILLMTLNRPHARNAVNAALSTALGAALEQLAVDPELRVGVITGAGAAFSAGADLKELAQNRPVHALEHPEWGFGGIVQHYIDKPLIAAVNGFALGGGTEIALTCDLVVADETASFGLPEVRQGLLAAAGGVFRLPRQIPWRVAMELILTGEAISADRAAALGLVNRVTKPGQCVAGALALAELIAGNAPLSVQASKRLVHASKDYGSDWDDELWALNRAEMLKLWRTADAREGSTAFAERRSPVWRAC
jgi:crotonobetainyl-CoA hydratase